MSAASRGASDRYGIRVAAPGDVPAIAAIEGVAFSDPWSPSSFEEIIARDGVVFVAAERREEARGPGAVVGYAIAYHGGGEAELANVAVAEPERGQGLGAMLVQDVLARVGRAGAQDCWLEVRASNEAARRLYRQLGFDDVGLRKRYYARPVEDAVVMRKALGVR